jgi:hypothetical protein
VEDLGNAIDQQRKLENVSREEAIEHHRRELERLLKEV